MPKVVLFTGVLIVIPIAFVVLAAVIIAPTLSGPSWQLSAHNSDEGVIIEIYKSDADHPTYKTLLLGQTIEIEVDRIARPELPTQLGLTTFYDETVQPGRWTVVINETEIDILERAMILDDSTEIKGNPD